MLRRPFIWTCKAARGSRSHSSGGRALLAGQRARIRSVKLASKTCPGRAAQAHPLALRVLFLNENRIILIPSCRAADRAPQHNHISSRGAQASMQKTRAMTMVRAAARMTVAARHQEAARQEQEEGLAGARQAARAARRAAGAPYCFWVLYVRVIFA